MKGRMDWRSSLLVAGLATALAPNALGGTPLICHPFNIGDARSLPWGNAEKGWNSPQEGYDIARLADDTVALLTEAAPPIVRMETIRRAVLYAARDPSSSAELLRRLKDRAASDGRNKALFLFDYGYMIETMKQASLMKESRSSELTKKLNGYPFIKEALLLGGPDPQMEFAAALVSLWPKNVDYQEHFRNAIAAAPKDLLIASNLQGRFPNR